MKVPNPENENEEIEVFTAEEVAERETAAKAAVEGEYKPKLEDATKKLTAAEEAAAQRALEFGQFRKLSDEQVKALSEKDAIIYNNSIKLQEAMEREAAGKKAALEATVETALRAKAGTDEKLFEKMKATWGLINVEANTPEQIEQKTMMVLGAISTTQPDLVASVQGFSGGSFEPPKDNKLKEGESFADTPAGKQAAAELGLMTEPPKQK